MADTPKIDTPRIQIDSDWKAEAQKEKERLTKVEAEKAQSKAGRSGPGGEGAEGALPPADFQTIISMLAQQAIMGLGVLADRKSGGVIVDLEAARFAIDLLDVLEQKTRGNLSKEEAEDLKQVLANLRTRFVQVAAMVSKQMSAQPAGGASQPPASPESGPIVTE
jgi:hypothetical protein